MITKLKQSWAELKLSMKIALVIVGIGCSLIAVLLLVALVIWPLTVLLAGGTLLALAFLIAFVFACFYVYEEL